jgi:Mor family transcriptional regulator
VNPVNKSANAERLEAYRLKYGDAAYARLIYEFGGCSIRFPKYIGNFYPDKRKRNDSIRADWYSGMDFVDLQKKYGLSKDRLRKIINTRSYKPTTAQHDKG